MASPTIPSIRIFGPRVTLRFPGPPGSAGALADGAVTTPKLADGAVTTPKLADGAVTTPKLGASAVQTGNIQNNHVTLAKLANLSAAGKVLGTGEDFGGPYPVSEIGFGAGFLLSGNTVIPNPPAMGIAASDVAGLQLPLVFNVTRVTLTNQANAETFFSNTLGCIFLVDLTRYQKVRFVCHVFTASASANTPKMRLRYKAGALSSPSVIGDFTLDIGTSEVKCSLAAIGMIDSGVIDLAAGAKGDVYVCATQMGGDAAADPAVCTLTAYFYGN